MAKIYQPIDDFKVVELPEKQLPFWKIAGPGAILVGLSIGAGESVIWPRIVAEYGGSMIWAAVLGVFLQLWINFEVGRWTIATGETVYTGYSRIWRGFAPLFILLTVVGWIAPWMGTDIRTRPESPCAWPRRLGFRYLLDDRDICSGRAHPLRAENDLPICRKHG